MRLQHIAEQVYSKPWLITPSGHDAVRNLVESKLAKGLFEFKSASAGGFQANDEEANALFVQREPASLDVNGIGHINIQGVIAQGISPLEKTCGNTDTRDIQIELAALLAQGAKGILLCIDSPGGTITGIPELGDAIAAAAVEVPLFVFSDSQICSAAFWLAAGASKIICTESAEIGSIGVFLPWVDRSAQLEQQGLRPEPVINTGGAFKAMGATGSLTPEHRAQLQSYVDRVFGLFRTHVQECRANHEADVPNDAMQGQVFLGLDAQPNGLVDILGSKEDAYELLLGGIDFDIDAVQEPAPIEEVPTEGQTPST